MIEIVRADSTEETYRGILKMLVLEMHPEVGLEPLDADRTMDGVYDCLTNGVVFNAIDGDKLAGSVGAIAFAGWWYSTSVTLFDRWFYVRRDYRGGDVGTKLEAALRNEAESRNMRAYLALSNPNRVKRGRVAEIGLFQPIGRIVRLNGG